MRFQSKYCALFVLIAALLLSACGPNADASPMDDSGPVPTINPEEGGGVVYYHYHLHNDLINFDLDPVISITFGQEENASTYDITGMGETMVKLDMLAEGGPTGSCQVQCEMTVRYAAQGTLQLGSNGKCELHMNFIPGALEDESILTGDCPQEFMDVFNCSAMSAVMMDPSLYVFTKSNMSPKIDTAPAVFLQAELRNLVLPPGVSGLCSW